MNSTARTCVLGVVLFAFGCTLLPLPVAAQSWREETLLRQRTSEGRLDVEVQYGMGRFRVDRAEEGLLYRVDLRYDEEVFEPVVEYRDGRLHLRSHESFRFRRGSRGGHLDLSLPRDVDLDLRLELGAVRAEMELGGLRLADLSIATGAAESRIAVSEPNPIELPSARMQVGAAEFTVRGLGNLNAERIEVEAGIGEVTLDLSGEWRRDAEVSVEMGFGALHLHLPEGLGVRLVRSSFLTSFDPRGLVQQGDAHVSPNWDRAERRVTIRIDAAVGSIDVNWVP